MAGGALLKLSLTKYRDARLRLQYSPLVFFNRNDATAWVAWGSGGRDFNRSHYRQHHILSPRQARYLHSNRQTHAAMIRPQSIP
jgi:hypothetical protein